MAGPSTPLPQPAQSPVPLACQGPSSEGAVHSSMNLLVSFLAKAL